MGTGSSPVDRTRACLEGRFFFYPSDPVKKKPVPIESDPDRHMVEMRGVEPLSENPSTELSPSAFRDLISLRQPSAEKLPGR